MNIVTPLVLQDWLLNSETELAVLDVREAGEFGWGHLLFAIPLPYSRLEVELDRLVPHRATRLVFCDDGVSGVAQRAAQRAAMLGYEQVHVLGGGTAAWRSAGYPLFAGVHVPSKTFGELVEEVCHTPRISAQDLHARQARGEHVIVVDGRPFAEYSKMNIPGSVCCPNGELAYRISAIAPDESIPIVVNCAGRTRSIIGAQTLIDIGLRNPVYALENGTQGWALAGYDLEYGGTRRYPAQPPVSALVERAASVAALAQRRGVRALDVSEACRWLADTDRTTYWLDIRTPEEFSADAAPGAQSAPGGQLIQATDQWLAVRGARVLLADHDGIRAPVVAQWLRRLGWDAHTVRVSEGFALKPRDRECDIASSMPLPIPVEPGRLDDWRRTGECLLVDIRSSMDFRKGHIPGSIWSIRSRLAEDVPDSPRRVVLISDDLVMIRMAALELVQRRGQDIHYLEGGCRGWLDAGGRPEASPAVPTDDDAIDYLFFVHDRHDGNLDAARQYLAWEQGLVAMLDPAERARFNP
ncbi:rhodanese-like domain-containing protein [Castellaniella sp. GW247-6E4]|uniref:rhodanese-like domain-containing protein n=1 Tax=Castellaniella sp. GW247-6E4 TaxID=3140380 RepID=UPI003315E35A